MSAMFVAMVWHARRRQDALKKVEASGRGARRAARAAKAVPSRRLARAAYARDDCPRASRRPSGRTGTGLSTEVDVALDELGRIERILQQLLLLAKTDHPDFVLLRRHRPRVVSRGCLHALVGGRAARVAARPARRRDPCTPTRRRFGSRSTRCSRTPSTTRIARMRSNFGRGQRRKTIVLEVEDEGCGVPTGLAPAHLRALRQSGSRAVPRARRRRARARHRRRDREGARRKLRREKRPERHDVLPQAAGLLSRAPPGSAVDEPGLGGALGGRLLARRHAIAVVLAQAAGQLPPSERRSTPCRRPLA